MDLQRSMEEAVGLHRSGRFGEAAARYQAVLAAHPEQPDALHLLGLVTNRLGDPVQALALVERAVAARPDDPGFRFSHANLLIGAKRFADAEAAFRAVLAAAPDDPAAQNGLAIALEEQGRGADAEAELERLLERQPGFVPALDNLAAFLLKRGHLEAAERAEALARRSLAARPDGPEALNNLGSALIKQRREAEAEPPLQQAVQLRKDYAEAWFNLGLARIGQHKLPAADLAMRTARKLDPDSVAYMVGASRIARELALIDEALEVAKLAYARDPDSPEVMVVLAQAYRDQSDFAEAERLFTLVAERVNTPIAWTQLGHVHWEKGDLDKAREDLAKALALDPEFAEARYVLANCARQTTLEDPNIVKLKEIAARPDLRDEVRSVVEFALGKVHDDVGEHLESFAHYAEANRIKKRMLTPYVADAERRYEHANREVFTPETVARLAAHGSTSQVPVFVVGLPRSGTTLTEQIISSHPDAFGAGELLKLREVTARVSAVSGARGGRDYPYAVHHLRPDEIQRYSRMYLEHLEQRAGAPKLRIVDKMPLNLRYLGLIAVLFPNARVVHCTRNPMDNCVSIFFQNFGSGNLFAYDLDDLGRFYASCEALMRMWKQTLALPILEFPYEQVVEDPETWARRLIDHVGLPWDDRCLAFHQTERAVRTASAWQVKQPIYKRSVARWKRYGAGLDPLIARLKVEGVEVDA